jgi:short-subunit dehydrogenase
MPYSPPRRALITGATTGIGRATAELFASSGYEVGVLGYLAAEVDETVTALQSAGGAARGFCVDLSAPDQVKGLIDRLEDEGWTLNVLVNNAGVGLQADVLETRDEDLRRLFQVNFFAAYELSRDALRRMGERGQGAIIMVSSASARRSLPGLSVYGATKAAMHSFCQALRIEAREKGVSVTEMLPMSVRTPFFQAASNRSGHAYRPGGALMTTPEALARRILRAVEHPAPEVYTSTLARIAFALDGSFPKVLDYFVGRKRARKS